MATSWRRRRSCLKLSFAKLAARRRSAAAACNPSHLYGASPCVTVPVCLIRSQEVQAEKEQKRQLKEERKQVKLAATNVTNENAPPAAIAVPACMDGHVDGLPVAVVVPMPCTVPTPVAMPNLARAAAELGVAGNDL